MKENILAVELLSSMRDLHSTCMYLAPKNIINKSCFFALKKIVEFKEDNPDKIGATVKDLAKQSERTPASISQRVTALEDMGLVERISDKNDRRVVYFVVTGRGLEIYEKITREFENFVDTLIERLGEEEIKKTTEHIKNLCRTVKDIKNEKGR